MFGGNSSDSFRYKFTGMYLYMYLCMYVCILLLLLLLSSLITSAISYYIITVFLRGDVVAGVLLLDNNNSILRMVDSMSNTWFGWIGGITVPTVTSVKGWCIQVQRDRSLFITTGNLMITNIIGNVRQFTMIVLELRNRLQFFIISYFLDTTI